MHRPVFFPLLSPNEPEALVVEVYVSEGQFVGQGQPLCILETTKSTAEFQADAAGYILGLLAQQGQTVHAGDLFAYLADEAGETLEPDESTFEQPLEESAGLLPAGLRITQPALALARQHQLDLSRLPVSRLHTVNSIQALLAEGQEQKVTPSALNDFDPTAILVYGGGGHGKSVIELVRALRTYRVVGVVDDGLPPGSQILDLPVLGGGDELDRLYTQGVRLAANAVGGIGNLAVRIQVFERLAKAGFACPALVHPAAFIEPSARVAGGVQVFPHAYIGSTAELGFGCIVNTGAIVSHDCILGDYVNISPGAVLAGEVQIGRGVLIGMGVTINLQAKIGAEARIGNSAVVKSNVPEKGIVRAGAIWPE